MKKVILTLLVLTLFSCGKKEDSHTIQPSSSIIAPKNPLNKLTYANKIDFYCKMDITKYGVSDTVTYKGKLYGFCATMCKEEFLKNPEKYLAKK